MKCVSFQEFLLISAVFQVCPCQPRLLRRCPPREAKGREALGRAATVSVGTAGEGQAPCFHRSSHRFCVFVLTRAPAGVQCSLVARGI